jgi:uncharacterized phiE125 gp8 family phage protein
VWELALDSLAAQIELPYPPIISVDSIKYLDSSGVEQTIPPAEYVLYDYGTVGHYVAPVTAWPAASSGIRITYTAGYGDTAADVPSDMKAWMLLAIGTMYANREQTSVVATYALPDSFYSDLIAHYLTQRA